MTAKSKIEERFQHLLNEQKFPFTFRDPEGVEFKAKSDLILFNTVTGKKVYVELKPKECNTKTSIRTSYNQALNRCQRFGLPTTGDHYSLSHRLIQSGNTSARNAGYDSAWSNSIYKQRIVSAGMQQHEPEAEFLIVFATHTLSKLKLNKQQVILAEFYKIKHNLQAMYAEELEHLLNTGVLVPFTEALLTLH